MPKVNQQVCDLVINGRFLTQKATGVQRVAREFTIALDKLLREGCYGDIKVVLAAPATSDFASLNLARIRGIHVGARAGYVWEQWELPHFAGRAKLLCLGNTAPLLHMMAGGNVAVMLHDQAYRFYPEDYSLGYRLAHSFLDYGILRLAQPLFTVSEAEAVQLRGANPKLKRPIIVAPNGVWKGDECRDPPSREAALQQRYGLHVGGFGSRKNIEAVFAVARAIAGHGFSFKLVGSPNERAARIYAELSEPEKSLIKFTGFVDDLELEALYHEAAFLLYPSFYEASGLPPSEAMSLGCPVIVSDLPVLRERCGDAALYCPAGDPAAFAKTALWLLNEKSASTELSRKGLSQVSRFSWRRQAMSVMDALRIGDLKAAQVAPSSAASSLDDRGVGYQQR